MNNTESGIICIKIRNRILFIDEYKFKVVMQKEVDMTKASLDDMLKYFDRLTEDERLNILNKIYNM